MTLTIRCKNCAHIARTLQKILLNENPDNKKSCLTSLLTNFYVLDNNPFTIYQHINIKEILAHLIVDLCLTTTALHCILNTVHDPHNKKSHLIVDLLLFPDPVIALPLLPKTNH